MAQRTAWTERRKPKWFTWVILPKEPAPGPTHSCLFKTWNSFWAPKYLSSRSRQRKLPSLQGAYTWQCPSQIGPKKMAEKKEYSRALWARNPFQTARWGPKLEPPWSSDGYTASISPLSEREYLLGLPYSKSTFVHCVVGKRKAYYLFGSLSSWSRTSHIHNWYRDQNMFLCEQRLHTTGEPRLWPWKRLLGCLP